MAATADLEKWTAIIEAARKHPAGVKGYCQANGLHHHTYYKWFKRLKPAHPEWSKTIPRGKVVAAKATKTARFLSVKVVPDEPKPALMLAAEIRLSCGTSIFLQNGISPSDLAALILQLEGSAC